MAKNERHKATAIMVVEFEVGVEGDLGEVKQFTEVLQLILDATTFAQDKDKNTLAHGLRRVLWNIVPKKNRAEIEVKIMKTHGGIWSDFS